MMPDPQNKMGLNYFAYGAFDRVPFVWDIYLQPGEARKDMWGVWHVGTGTDLRVFFFDYGLSVFDKKFLQECLVKL